MLKRLILDHNPILTLFNKLTPKLSLLADLSNYLRQLLFQKSDPTLEKLLFLIGTATITYQTCSFLIKIIKSWKWLPKHFANQYQFSADKMKQKYGDCYVCVTGFTEGIGRGYAEIFAELGYNLVLIGISREQVQKKTAELTKIYPSTKIVSFWADFTKENQIKTLQSQLAELELDIGILVNNAGTISGGPYLEIKPEDTLRDIKVDFLAGMTMMKIMIPKLRNRHKRSAIVNMTSITALYFFPRLGVYSSVKKCLDITSRIVASENSDKIDVISVRPFGVSTRMSLMMKGAFVLTPRQCVLGVLSDLLGGQTATSSDFKHKAAECLLFEHMSESECLIFADKLQGEKGLQK